MALLKKIDSYLYFSFSGLASFQLFLGLLLFSTEMWMCLCNYDGCEKALASFTPLVFSFSQHLKIHQTSLQTVDNNKEEDHLFLEDSFLFLLLSAISCSLRPVRLYTSTVCILFVALFFRVSNNVVSKFFFFFPFSSYFWLL